MGLKTLLLGLDGGWDDVLDEADAGEVGVTLGDALDEQAGFFGAGLVFGQVLLGRADEDVVAVGGADGGGQLTDASGLDEEAGVLVDAVKRFGDGVDREGCRRSQRELLGLGAIGEGLASGDVGLEGLADLGDFLGEEAVELGLLPVLDGLSLRFVVGRNLLNSPGESRPRKSLFLEGLCRLVSSALLFSMARLFLAGRSRGSSSQVGLVFFLRASLVLDKVSALQV